MSKLVGQPGPDLEFKDGQAQFFFRMMMEEYNRARKKFGPFGSDHEGWAVIKEELDEVWDIIRGVNDPVEMDTEVIQLGAMVLAFWLELVVNNDRT